jgi:uncharacterized membrane protein YjjB (DUF3815 family)
MTMAVDSLQAVPVNPCESPASLAQGADLAIGVAEVLHANGESTDDTLSAALRFGDGLGLRVRLIPGWSDLHLQADQPGVSVAALRAASPTNINMNRVSSAVNTLNEVVAGKLATSAAVEVIRHIAGAAAAPDWLFTLAAMAGAVALSVIFGVEHWSVVLLIALSAGLGAVLRRAVARYSSNTLIQPFCAAVVAGVIGGLATRFNLSSSLMLVALCPCLVLVPGPHFLNGALDLLAARVSLGASRMVYAGMIMLAISVGLILGLALLGQSLTVDPPGRPVPLWLDMSAAGVAVAAYSVYYSTPPRMWAWPIVIGTLAHGLRFVSITGLGASGATGAFVACLVVGLVLTPVARWYHLPFAAVGFASVVSMIPGSYLIRMASGFVQLGDAAAVTPGLLAGTIADGATAVTVIVAMSAGLIVPKLALDRLHPTAWRRWL